MRDSDVTHTLTQEHNRRQHARLADAAQKKNKNFVKNLL
jgi:hypothetical protein